MHIIDIIVFVLYISGMLGIGVYFLKKNKTTDDYYVGGREMGSVHVGLSVVATDVGGGFSIGLGGLGYVIGIAGSWMLFTGLIGAWLSAVFLIPKLHKMPNFKKYHTFPQIFHAFYDNKVAITAGVISAIGYLGFTSSQVLAGAKLASATIDELTITNAVIFMGAIVVVYTSIGGLKAVIYTDTVQWALLMVGLIFVGIPIAYNAVGGWETIQATLNTSFFSFTNITWIQFANWFVTIVPIWFVGMTLYQRIYACRSEKEAKRAWFTAGIFEWPFMAMMGVILGLLSRVAVENGMFEYMGYATSEGLDSEMGLPLLLRTVLPVGFMGLMLSAYFSAIMSTADSCLMAASGNVQTDIIYANRKIVKSTKQKLRISQLLTLGLGVGAVLIAISMENVLELMLYSYAFMVSGLFIPVIGAFYWKKSSSTAALWAMIVGGTTTVVLTVFESKLPLGLDANVFGISAAAIIFISFSYIFPSKDITPLKKLRKEEGVE